MVDISNLDQNNTPSNNLDKRSSSNINATAGDGNQFFEKRAISKTASNSAGSSANVKASAKQVTSRLYP